MAGSSAVQTTPAPPATPDAQAPAAGQEQGQESSFNFWKFFITLFRAWVAFTLVSSLITSLFGSRSEPKQEQLTPPPASTLTTTTTPELNESLNPFSAFLQASSYTGPTSQIQPTFTPPHTSYPLRNLWRENARLEWEVYFSPEEHLQYDDLATTPLTTQAVKQTIYYDWDSHNVHWFGNEPYTNQHIVDLFALHPEYKSWLVRQNSTLYSHAFIYPIGTSPSIHHPRHVPGNFIHLSDSISRQIYVPKRSQMKKLFDSNTNAKSTLPAPSSAADAAIAADIAVDSKGDTIHYLIPSLTVRVILDHTVYNPSIPPPITQFYNVLPHARGYVPPAYIDRFWELRSQYVRLTTMGDADVDVGDAEGYGAQSDENEAETNVTPTKPHNLAVLNMTISYAPQSILRWQLQKQIDLSFKNQESLGLSTVKQTDVNKTMVLDTNPWFLGLTVLISLLHTLFEFLAFKNDISHFKSLKSTKGLSLYTLFYNAITQLIIFLYLYENETSYVVLGSTGFGVLLEIWKITKARDVVVDVKFPFIHIDKRKLQSNSVEGGAAAEDDEEDETEKYDAMAFKYLSWVMAPLGVGYAVYSVLYNEFTGWYSFILSTLVSYIYMFGFIPMTAQLFINYQLKSTAHIPVKVFVYKFLNTIVDDCFSFIIKMPFLHRLSCFRDDLVFLVLLYQKWIYRVDYSRANEYGQVFNDKGEQVTDATAQPTKQQQQQQQHQSAKPTSSTKPAQNKVETSTPEPIEFKPGQKSHMKKVEEDELGTMVHRGTNPKKTPASKSNATAAAVKKPDSDPTSKWGDESMYGEEVIPDWVIENQRKLLELRREEEEKMKNDPNFRSAILSARLEQEEALRKKFGEPKTQQPIGPTDAQPKTKAAPDQMD